MQVVTIDPEREVIDDATADWLREAVVHCRACIPPMLCRSCYRADRLLARHDEVTGR